MKILLSSPTPPLAVHQITQEEGETYTNDSEKRLMNAQIHPTATMAWRLAQLSQAINSAPRNVRTIEIYGVLSGLDVPKPDCDRGADRDTAAMVKELEERAASTAQSVLEKRKLLAGVRRQYALGRLDADGIEDAERICVRLYVDDVAQE